MPLRFIWDKTKARANQKKHRISFEEAATVFGDPLSLTIHDPDHSTKGENRFITLGISARQRPLVVIHWDTGGMIRVISARKATRSERKQYEET